jgi:hypothetical protein
MKSQLFIPKKIKVGYQKREDTYTKRLGYVIYYDNKNVLRKEKSWKGWITPQLGTPDFDNVPTEGFVLNKDVGGVRSSWSSWNQRMEKVRVFDPRGFEFEINIPNMLYILQECSSFKGKGLEGEFVYAWDGQELVLLPVGSKEYKDCSEFTSIQGNKVKKYELIPGATYQTKKQETVIYLGKFPTYGGLNYSYGNTIGVDHEHVFVDESKKRGEELTYHQFSKLDGISNVVEEQCHPKFASMVDKLLNKPLIGLVHAVSETKAPVALKKDSQYSYDRYDYTEQAGRCSYYNHEYGTITKIPGTYFIPVEGQPNSWYVCTFVRHIEVKKDEKKYEQTWKLKGFEGKCGRILKFENNELIIKAVSKKPFKELLSVSEIKALNTYNLSAKLSDNKNYLIFNTK